LHVVSLWTQAFLNAMPGICRSGAWPALVLTAPAGGPLLRRKVLGAFAWFVLPILDRRLFPSLWWRLFISRLCFLTVLAWCFLLRWRWLDGFLGDTPRLWILLIIHWSNSPPRKRVEAVELLRLLREAVLVFCYTLSFGPSRLFFDC